MAGIQSPMWIALPPGLLVMNEPLPVEVRDPYGKVLAQKGQRIAEHPLLQRIQAIGLCRIADLELIDELEVHPASPIKTHVSLDEFPLNMGATLFLTPRRDERTGPVPAHLIGKLPGTDLLVVPVTGEHPETIRLKLQAGELLRVRVAVGQDVLLFDSPVTHVNLQPYWHLHLGWPATVTLQQDRLCPRMPVHQPVLVERAGDIRRSALMLNLSETGALLQYHTQLGHPGSEIRLRFALAAERGHASLTLKGIIRNEHSGLPSEDVVLHGIEFIHPRQDDLKAIRRFLQRHLLAADRL
ncbi:PilZ domain-containing protein [Chitinilyticum litopenaei]|uniref:PilZ domain-containing protein n=1 Tax=Chitinilyticum litopenaei TaxID=1121276 RepID=UPI00130E6783|nr:PilZ domain-containing protein [Chitinilyticum litopenaei]